MSGRVLLYSNPPENTKAFTVGSYFYVDKHHTQAIISKAILMQLIAMACMLLQSCTPYNSTNSANSTINQMCFILDIPLFRMYDSSYCNGHNSKILQHELNRYCWSYQWRELHLYIYHTTTMKLQNIVNIIQFLTCLCLFLLCVQCRNRPYRTRLQDAIDRTCRIESLF